MAVVSVSVCKKIKLKNFYDPKLVGGCGVVPILSSTRLFFQGVRVPVERSGDGRRKVGLECCEVYRSFYGA